MDKLRRACVGWEASASMSRSSTGLSQGVYSPSKTRECRQVLAITMQRSFTEYTQPRQGWTEARQLLIYVRETGE
eukprot:262193-Pelagomonas_calceolata.AAC.2